MRCDNCPALFTEGYEYPEAYCAVYPESECIEFKDESLGCRHRLSTIQKRLEKWEEYKAHEWDGYAEYYEHELEIEKAIKEAVLYACGIEHCTLAYEGIEGELCKANMRDEIPSLLHDFVFRIKCYLDDNGYDIERRKDNEQVDKNK